jgi:Sulfotransferase family
VIPLAYSGESDREQPDADGDKKTVVAPQIRTPQITQYLSMVTSLDPVIATRREWDVDQLLELAQSRTDAVLLSADSGLHFEGLRCLAESIQLDPYYDDVGGRAANFYIYNWITKYLQFERDLAAFPDIVRVPVPKPMFIVGFGRTGSTFLHHLLALDSQARAPRLWELMEPSPPPRRETYDTDPRIRRVQLHLSSTSIMMPDLHKIHESDDAQAPEECHVMMWHGPHHITFGLRSSEYWQWLRNLEFSQLQVLYKSYRLQVQHLQLFYRGEHWVSKALSHAHFFPVMFQTFPDARVVRLHRDPCQIIPALASIIAHLQIPYTSRIDFRELGQRMLDIFVNSMQRSMQIEKEVSSEHFIDVLFEDLTRDPIGVIRDIYSRCGYQYTGQFESDMRKFLQTERVTRKYKHAYTLEQFGLSRTQIMTRSEEYLTWVERRTGSRLCRP